MSAELGMAMPGTPPSCTVPVTVEPRRIAGGGAATVLASGYADGLELAVHELTVLEEDFTDVALDVVMPPQVVTLRR